MEAPVEEMVEKIARECREAGASQWDAAKVVKSLRDASTKSLARLRELAIKELESSNPRAAAIYQTFHRMRVFTSAQRVESFDRGNIIRSLLKETNITPTLAKTIGTEVEDKIKDLDVTFLTTALIRELVLEKLLTYGREPVHRQYARVGMPVHDVKEHLASAPLQDAPLLAEYTLLRVLSPEQVRLHAEGELYIPRVEHFPLRIHAAALTSANDIWGIQKQVLSCATLLSCPPSLHAANFELATKQKPKQAAKKLGNALDALAPQAKALVNLHFFTPARAKLAGREEAMGFAHAWLANQRPATVSVDDHFKLKLLKETKGPLTIYNHGHSTPHYALANGLLSPRPSALLETVLNLPLLWEKTQDEGRFFELIQERAQDALRLLSLKERQLAERKHLKKAPFEWEEGMGVLRLYGLAMASHALASSNDAKKQSTAAAAVVKRLTDTLGERWLIRRLEDEALRNHLSTFLTETSRQGKKLGQDTHLSLHYLCINPAKNLKEAETLLEAGAGVVSI